MAIDSKKFVDNNELNKDLPNFSIELKQLKELVQNVEFSLQELDKKVDGIPSWEAIADPMAELLKYLSINSEELISQIENKENWIEDELEKITEQLSKIVREIDPKAQSVLDKLSNKKFTEEANIWRKNSNKIVISYANRMYNDSPDILKSLLKTILKRAEAFW